VYLRVFGLLLASRIMFGVCGNWWGLEQKAQGCGGMRRWLFGVSALLFSCFATLGAVVISELHTEAGQPGAPTIPYIWLWLGDAAVFAVSVALLYFAVRQNKLN
jgi:hypothetical protein